MKQTLQFCCKMRFTERFQIKNESSLGGDLGDNTGDLH